MTGPTVPGRLDLASDLRHRSVFLFGPRQTGKTTWLSALFPHAPVFNLLRGEVFLRLSREPGRLRQELATVSRSSVPVIIDEIQKLPSLLDEVHDLIESRGLQFVLAASSPAKLRRGGVNLLGGRARTRLLFPFVSAEVPNWDLMRREAPHSDTLLSTSSSASCAPGSDTLETRVRSLSGVRPTVRRSTSWLVKAWRSR